MRKNKSGKNSVLANVGIVFGIIVAIVFLLGVTGIVPMNLGGGSDGEGGLEGCGDSTTTLTFPAKNYYSLSSSVSATPYGRITPVNGVASDLVNLSSIGAIGVDSKITDIFYSASNYIDVKADDFVVKCGQTLAPSVKMKPTDNPDTFYVSTKGGTTLTDSATGGASNATSTSGTLELILNLGATTDETTGDLVVVIEYDNTTQADTISLSGASEYTPLSGDIEDVYTKESAGASVTKAFLVKAIEDGDSGEYTAKIFPESGQTLASTAVRFTISSKQAFEDTDGSVQVDIADSDGTSKSEDSSDYDVYVGA